MQQLCPECPKAAALMGPRTLRYLTAVPARVGTSGQPHQWVTFCCAQVHAATDVTACGSLLLLPIDQAQEGNTFLTSSGNQNLSNQECFVWGKSKASYVWTCSTHTAWPSHKNAAVSVQRHSEVFTCSCVCRHVLTVCLSTAWHTEASLQIRDEGLFLSFPIAN